MGLLRLLLALAVLLSHAGVRVFQLNPGVTAVIGFYLISGYVMAGLVHRHYSQPDRVPMFYLDRVLRLFPQYLVYAGATLVWHLWSATPTLFLKHPPTWVDLVNNLTVVPLNFYMYNGSDAYTLIPPAWSLGAELQFYLLAPLMLIWPRLGLALAALSAAVHAGALLGRLNTDWYGYRLLPGVLWVFGVGMLMFHWRRSRPRLALVLAGASPVLALVVCAWLRSRGLHSAPYHQEVLLGWGLGIPLLYWVTRAPGASRWDAVAGDLSYGVFLNHFLLIYVLFPGPSYSKGQLFGLVITSIALSFLTQHWLERPVLAWRRRLRL